MSTTTLTRTGTRFSGGVEHSAWLGWMETAPSPDLVAVSHGTGDPAGRAAVRALVDVVDLALSGIRVHGAFVDVQEPRVGPFLHSGAIEPGQAAALVPLLLSAGTHASGDLAAATGALPGTKVAAPLGPDASLAAVLHRRLLEAGWLPGEAVVLACAGSTDPRGLADCHTMAQLLAGRLQVPVTPAFISAAEPRLPDVMAAARSLNPGRRTVVASYLLAPGHFATLAAGSSPDVLSAPLLDPNQAPPRELVDIVIQRYRQCVDW
ncbi:sirohydrochlorin chelatase [Paeniglutamicibacter sp. MACA_103]|uniref:sirohydrochlorin chelatase n=1 Tax=Paeniglutamicibacter sp. MACA_103 TaxID=3377337 RepID=UPI00389466C2